MTTFTDFWQLARGCRGRLNSGGEHESEKSWNKVVKAGAEPRIIIAGWLGYQSAMDDTDTDLQFRKMATTFLNQWLFKEHLDERAAREYLARPELRARVFAGRLLSHRAIS